jgi:hypothetical protein
MRMVARVLLVAFCSLVLFIVGVLGTSSVNLLIYGADEFNGNAGAKFAALMEGAFIGFILAVGGIPISIILSRRIPYFRRISN